MVASSQVACLSIDNFMFTCYTTYLSPQTTMDNRHQSTPPCDLLISHRSSGVGWPTKHLCEDTLRVLWGQGSPHVFINTYTMYIYIYTWSIYQIKLIQYMCMYKLCVPMICIDMHWYTRCDVYIQRLSVGATPFGAGVSCRARSGRMAQPCRFHPMTHPAVLREDFVVLLGCPLPQLSCSWEVL